MQHFEISVIVSMDVVKNLLVEKKKKMLSNSIRLCTQVCVHIACWKTASSRTSTIRMATKPGTIARTIPATGSYK